MQQATVRLWVEDRPQPVYAYNWIAEANQQIAPRQKRNAPACSRPTQSQTATQHGGNNMGPSQVPGPFSRTASTSAPASALRSTGILSTIPSSTFVPSSSSISPSSTTQPALSTTEPSVGPAMTFPHRLVVPAPPDLLPNADLLQGLHKFLAAGVFRNALTTLLRTRDYLPMHRITVTAVGLQYLYLHTRARQTVHTQRSQLSTSLCVALAARSSQSRPHERHHRRRRSRRLITHYRTQQVNITPTSRKV